MEWDGNQRWRQQIERRLNEIGSRTVGNQQYQADRVADLLEQIDELRKELQRVAERQDRIAEWLKARAKPTNGEST